MAFKKISGPVRGDSPLMMTRSNLSRAFFRIAHKLFRPCQFTRTEEDYDRIRQVYGVEKDKADILAVFFSRPGWHIPSSDDDLKILGLKEDHLQECLDELRESGFLVSDSDPDPAYATDEAFILSVREDVPLTEAQASVLENLFDLAVDDPQGTSRDGLRTECKPPEKGLNDREHPVMLSEEEPEDDSLGSFFRQGGVETDDRPIKRLDKALARYRNHPFAKMVQHYFEDLTHTQKMLLFYMLRQFKHRFIQPIRPSELNEVIGQFFSEEAGTLMEKGLICSCYVWDRENNSTNTEYYRITPELAALFKGREKVINKRAVSSIGSFVTPEDIEKKELFFPAEDRKDMERISRAASPGEYDRIISELKARRLRPCLSVLMYGPPGTGKTELALQVARNSGRALLKADISRLNGIYIGEGAIHFRDLFQTYRYLCAVSRLAPILFLDEGDGMMSKRIPDAQRVSDKDFNSIQSVILEEFNTLPGLVIVTTNLITNLDDAMFRRFMIKVRFHLPDVETRTAIWMSRLPSLSHDEAAVLAREFAISPGLIDNVVSTAVTDEILYKKPVGLNDLISYCKAQLVGSEQTPTRKIGFNNC